MRKRLEGRRRRSGKGPALDGRFAEWSGSGTPESSVLRLLPQKFARKYDSFFEKIYNGFIVRGIL